MLILSFLSCFHTYGDYQDLRWELLDQDGDGYIWDRFPEEDGDDCDDFNADVHPGKAETPYNNIDDDCDSETPDDDLDGDGYGIETDCDDSDNEVNPGMTEITYNYVDEDCDLSTPDDDIDGDGYSVDEDCDDTDYSTNPGAMEVPYTGKDEDCDDSTKDDDIDGDGHSYLYDCDDLDSESYPGAVDDTVDGTDQNCDGIDGNETGLDDMVSLSGQIVDTNLLLSEGDELEIRLYISDDIEMNYWPEEGNFNEMISVLFLTWDKNDTVEYVVDSIAPAEKDFEIQAFLVSWSENTIDYVGKSDVFAAHEGQLVSGVNIYVENGVVR
jgi:hypothetical protein